ncbi:hypothetical protein FSO04_24135 [Paraburkholderia madseniana]|uniref:Uncharacterized protein n=1 Tax=Paraburkholderia madseniana TaxID=2599607 RepID=A0A6N6WC44_9BURK|nr:hypothetical protein [Paraburkholderia madseniana]KAE8757314.1 hypothetical protein FSO04_24135 [Paraburkholderia madseniana]
MTQPLTSLNQKTILRIVQEVMGDFGLPQPTQVVGNTDKTVSQLLIHATRVGEDLAARGSMNDGWPVMRKEYTFNLVGYGGYSGNVTAGSNVITGMPSTTNIAIGMVGTSTATPYGVTVTGVTANSVTLDQPALSTQNGALFSFGNESYAIPADADHFIQQTGWDRSFRWQLVGPLSAQEWQVLKSGISPTGPRLRYRIMDGLIFVNPVPASLDNLVMEYYSTGWCQSATGTPQTSWAADTDTPVLQDRLFTLGIIARFLNRKGFDSTSAQREYDDAVEAAIGRAGGSRVLPINARAEPPILIGSANLPDTGYGS